MARRKDTISQRDFSLGAVRPEAVERDDTALIERSVKEAKNTVSNTVGGLDGRPGSVFYGFTESVFGFGVDLGAGREYDLQIVPNGVVLYDADGAVVASFLSSPWSSVADKWLDPHPVFVSYNFWVSPDPDSSSILIGSKYFPIHALTVDSSGVWSFGQMNFATKLNGVVLQPYWNYYPSVSIQPSARTGAITITASSSIWTSNHNGILVRYGGREVVLGSLVSGTVINATVTEELAPTYDLTVASVSGYQVGEAVEHDTLGGQGIITAISGSIVTVLATAFWDGFAASGKLTGPNANQAISVMATVAPAPSYLWDVQMANKIHGFAGSGEKHMGRTYLCAFPNAPQGFAASVAGFSDDFTMGANDGDGFVETLGANDGGELRYIVSAEDLLFFTSKGLYYQQTRDGSAVTPRSIGPVRFSRRGCADVAPVSVEDGAIFIDALGEQIYGAMLTGVQYRSWSAVHLSKYHSHLFSQPRYLGATSDGSETPEEFIYVVNDEGSAVAGRIDRNDNSVGWHPWETEGDYWSIYQSCGQVRQIVVRSLSAGSYCMERVVDGIYVDCASSLLVTSAFPNGLSGASYFGGTTAFATHLDTKTAAVYFEGWDLGDRIIDASGVPLDDDGNQIAIPDYGSNSGYYQVGFPFEVRIVPWPRRSINSYRGKRDVKRTVGMLITVQDSRAFSYDGQDFGSYRVGEDLTLPPPTRSEEASFITGGRDFFEDRPIVKDRPGPLRILKFRYKVTI